VNTVFYTGNGDKGSSFIANKNIPKDAPIMKFLGTLDECNSYIGLAVSYSKEDKIRNILLSLQNDLFIIQAEVAGIAYKLPSKVTIRESHTKKLEGTVISLDSEIPKITTFVLPGGSKLAAYCDVARSVARRVERVAIEFESELKITSNVKKYLNRLSSVLFALARYSNVVAGVSELAPTYNT